MFDFSPFRMPYGHKLITVTLFVSLFLCACQGGNEEDGNLPATAAASYMKIVLPLYQTLMEEAGYENGQWVLNTQHDFALGSEKRPFGKGIFRRIHDTMTGLHSTGLYINTNKASYF